VSTNIQRVWLILARVDAVGENPVGLTIGSEALVQCFVPETVLEIALVDCDRVLQKSGLRRTDVLKCVSFHEIDPEDEVAEFIQRDVLLARSSGEPVLGTFFTSEDSASFQHTVEE
jgi:hypothetical protein